MARQTRRGKKSRIGWGVDDPHAPWTFCGVAFRVRPIPLNLLEMKAGA
jgi:hypothetical protein